MVSKSPLFRKIKMPEKPDLTADNAMEVLDEIQRLSAKQELMKKHRADNEVFVK